MILLANVLQRILHQVLLITRIKISRYCSTINFTEDYFRQQYQRSAKRRAYLNAQYAVGTLEIKVVRPAK